MAEKNVNQQSGLATIDRPWPDGQMAINGHFCHIWPSGHRAMAINSGKWGIPEKSYKNVAQQ